MYLSRGICYLFILKILLLQVISSHTITFKDGEITYEYNESDRIGRGTSGNVYKGTRTDGTKSDDVAFKVARTMVMKSCMDMEYENDIYEKIGDHDSIPKLYKYFPEANGKATLVTELLGNSLSDLYRKQIFSLVTVMRIGLQVLDVLEYLHKVKRIVHYDVKAANLAVGYKNVSRIYIFDFNVSGLYPFEEKWPRNDIDDLAYMLITFLGSDWSKKRTIKWQIQSNDLDKTSGKESCIEALKRFMDESFRSNQPDYKALRNILETELEKHKDEPNYDKFDWQV